jgi:Leucine-rich repeat (LRR) protein
MKQLSLSPLLKLTFSTLLVLNCRYESTAQDIHKFYTTNCICDTLQLKNISRANVDTITKLILVFNQKGFNKSISYDSLNTIIKKLPKLEYLEVINLDIGKIPSALYESNRIKRIFLEKCNIQRIDSSLYNLNQLLAIGFDVTPLSKIDPGISKLKKLRRLVLDCSKLEKIPEEIYELKSLLNLELSGSKRLEISENIGKLKKLQSVRFIANDTIIFPENFKRMKSIKILTLRNSNYNREMIEKYFSKIDVTY